MKPSDPVIDGFCLHSGCQCRFLGDDKQGLLGSGTSRIKELPSLESELVIGHKTIGHCEPCDRWMVIAYIYTGRSAPLLASIFDRDPGSMSFLANY